MAEFIEHFVVPNGSEVLVNSTTANNQDQPRITKLAGGGFVVLWRDASGALGTGTQTEVRAQIYDANGAPVGAELLLNATFSTATNFPSIAALPGGGFVASWSDSSAGIILRQFDAAGTPATGEVSVQTTNGLTLGSRPDIAVQPNGQYLVTWHVQVAGENGGPNNFDVRGRLFGADGPLGVDFLVTAGTVGDQGRPRVAALSSGQYLVTWDENVGDGTLLNVKAQLLDATGARIGGEISVAQQAGNQFEPVVASLPDGRFVISWSAVEAGLTTLDVRAQLFSATGAKLGLEFRVNTETASDQTRPTVAALSDGRFLISWTDNGTTADPSPAGIKARLFDADGAALGTEFLVNSFTQNGQTDSAVAVLASGKLAVVWRDQSAQSMGSSVDSSGSGIKLQLLQALPHIVGTSGDDFLFGGAGGEIFEALGGNDLVSAGGGDDQIEGGDGNDSLNGGDGRDALWGGSGNDSLDGGAGADDFLYGGDGDDTLNDSLGGSGVLLGEAGNDTISVSGAAGGFTGFRLDGGEGDDVLSAASNGPATLSASLNGGEGNDRLTITGAVSGGLFGEEGDDIITFAGRGATIDGGPGDDTIYLNGQNATIHVSKDFYTDLGRDLIIPAAVGGFVTIIGFAAGEAGDRLDLSVYGADPFRAGGPLTYTQNGPDTLIDHAATGKRFVLQNVRFSDLSVFNLGVQTGAYNPQGRTIDDAFADQPNTDFPGYLIGADAADIIRGHGGADMLFGGGGNDRIEGGVGDDRIFGGTGADTMIGGAGNDSYEVDGLDDVVIEAAGEGVADEIRTTLSNYQLPANVERLVYIGAGSATFTGSAGGNHFTGAAAGDVFFLQQGGDDTAFGGGGNDGFYLGAALNAGDELDGGAGTLDQLGLQGQLCRADARPQEPCGHRADRAAAGFRHALRRHLGRALQLQSDDRRCERRR
jgi:Ca2+-binding RTX toxin-like protein